MKTFIILIMLYTGGTTTLTIEAVDDQEAIEIAQGATSIYDTLIIM